MSGEICTDNRFEIIAAYKKKLIECTNIETRPEEMAVIDDILFRFWQMGWLPPDPRRRLIDADALIEKVIAKYLEHERKGELVFAAAEIKQDIVDLISDAPTIIPAEEGE